MVVVGAQLAH